MFWELVKIYFVLHIAIGLFITYPIFVGLCRALDPEEPEYKSLTEWTGLTAIIIFIVWPVLFVDVLWRKLK